MTPAALAPLAAKYRRMLALRHAGAGDRAALRALAADFPGALRELDTLPTDEIARRAEATAAGVFEPWMEWMLAYHALMRAALLLKRRLAAGGSVDDALLDAVRAASGAPIDAAFARAVAAPIHGRLMAEVFGVLAARFGRERRELWDALFPPRRGPRDYRR
jgi:hypothetical protein